MDSKPTEIAKTAQTAKPQPLTGATKRGRPKQSSSSLLQAKHLVDEMMPHLQGFPQLIQEAAALGDRILSSFVDEERRSLNIAV